MTARRVPWRTPAPKAAEWVATNLRLSYGFLLTMKLPENSAKRGGRMVGGGIFVWCWGEGETNEDLVGTFKQASPQRENWFFGVGWTPPPLVEASGGDGVREGAGGEIPRSTTPPPTPAPPTGHPPLLQRPNKLWMPLSRMHPCRTRAVGCAKCGNQSRGTLFYESNFRHSVNTLKTDFGYGRLSGPPPNSISGPSRG